MVEKYLVCQRIGSGLLPRAAQRLATLTQGIEQDLEARRVAAIESALPVNDGRDCSVRHSSACRQTVFGLVGQLVDKEPRKSAWHTVNIRHFLSFGLS